MALSQAVIATIVRELHSAREILANPRSTQSQRTVARLVLDQWSK
jgi:hypothetical protein